jgi:hypothetical protein
MDGRVTDAGGLQMGVSRGGLLVSPVHHRRRRGGGGGTTHAHLSHEEER